MHNNSKPIQVIGIDASGLESLSEYKKNLILNSNRIAAPTRLLESIIKWCKREREDNSPQQFFKTDNVHELISWIKKGHHKTTILASGDPLWFGIGRQVMENFSQSEVCFHPSPTSFQIAFSRIGVPWQNSSWVSLHGRDPYQLAKSLQKRPDSLVIVTDPTKAGAKEVQEFLKASGLEQYYDFWIFEKLGHSNERIHKIKPKHEIPKGIDSLHIVILTKRAQLIGEIKDLPLFGVNDGVFAQYEDCPGLMTKREIRIQILADLHLPSEGVIWDICAGVGSIGLEALRIRPKLKLMSVEKRIGSKKLITQNAKILGVKPKEVFENEACELLKTKENIPKYLTNPSRVIIGGGGTLSGEILTQILNYINSEGIIVIPIVSLQSIEPLTNILESRAKQISISQHQSYRGVPLKNDIRLSPLNPVFIIKAQL